jgi:predicted helicase
VSTDHPAKLAQIKRFDQLVGYLRNEMGWPIDNGHDFEDVTFEYTPEELGIDPKNAAKIQEIKRLRPLSTLQPWGIFFIKFEPKRLPVVALRRILGQVALKKRASANSSERQAWAADDLLFISNYGEGEERRIALAHFSRPNDGADLPTLKVLGWDNLDTSLHLDAVAQELSEHLSWPSDESDINAWRDQWRSAFVLKHQEVINTSKQLSERLAELARAICDRIRTVLTIETETGPLTELLGAFRNALVHDLDEAGFADMYAQTIAYGLLSARITDPRQRTADDFAAHMRTNPFLKELMETFLHAGGRRGKAGGQGIDFDELGVSEVVALLDTANMEAVIRDFGDRNPQEDPVIHFYEHFLAAYDKKQKVSRGVFYTPRPIVSYIVRSVDELLRTEFGLEDGLADTATWADMTRRVENLDIPDGTSPDQDFVQILDPATGTGTFLVEVIDTIHKTLVTKWKVEGHDQNKIDELWNEYVPKHLLTRLHGYELLMAPYAIAHLKVGLKLYETGYRFESDERARVYLTNALEPADNKQLTLDLLPALAHEAQAVNGVKQHQRFTVVIGNPPYRGEAGTGGEWIAGLMRGQDTVASRKTASYFEVAGSPLKERNSKWINDDYVKFTRLSHFLIDTTGVGVHGYISNHGYLDNPTFRGMRWALLASFDQLHALDLHGNLNKKEATPGGGQDINVFDIEQGVGIGLFIKQQSGMHDASAATVFHADVWGKRTAKYDWLINHNRMNTDWSKVEASAPFYLFEPLDGSEVGDYLKFPGIGDVMLVNSVGIVTARDDLTIQWVADAVWKIVQDVAGGGAEAIRNRYALGKDSRDWKVAYAQADLKRTGPSKTNIVPILYRPFDTRKTYYTERSRGFLCMPRGEVMPHLLAGENLAIGTTRLTQDNWSAFSMRSIMAHKAVSRYDIGYTFPLYLYPGVGKSDGALFQTWPEGKGGRRPNLEPGFVDAITQATGLMFISDGCGDLKPSGDFGPEDVLAYIYAVFHCPEYRRRFEPMLKLDFPRVPPPAAAESFATLAQLGHNLLALHLLESPKLAQAITDFTGSRNPEVEKVSWSRNAVWLDQAQTIGFKGVREEVWNFDIGGYQVCNKWLKDRKGRTLSDDDIAHYQKIVVALSETIRIMGEIDEVIEAHGVWPGAFLTDGESEGKDVQFPVAAEQQPSYSTSDTKDGGE